MAETMTAINGRRERSTLVLPRPHAHPSPGAHRMLMRMDVAGQASRPCKPPHRFRLRGLSGVDGRRK